MPWSNSKSLGNHVVSLGEKERLQWEGFVEKEGFKSGMKERVGDGKLTTTIIIISITVSGIYDHIRFYSSTIWARQLLTHHSSKATQPLTAPSEHIGCVNMLFNVNERPCLFVCLQFSWNLYWWCWVRCVFRPKSCCLQYLRLRRKARTRLLNVTMCYNVT